MSSENIPFAEDAETCESCKHYEASFIGEFAQSGICLKFNAGVSFVRKEKICDSGEFENTDVYRYICSECGNDFIDLKNSSGICSGCKTRMLGELI